MKHQDHGIRLFFRRYFQLSELFIVPKVWYRLPEGKDR